MYFIALQSFRNALRLYVIYFVWLQLCRRLTTPFLRWKSTYRRGLISFSYSLYFLSLLFPPTLTFVLSCPRALWRCLGTICPICHYNENNYCLGQWSVEQGSKSLIFAATLPPNTGYLTSFKLLYVQQVLTHF